MAGSLAKDFTVAQDAIAITIPDLMAMEWPAR
jgi:hypothetical protein